jgi:hypothetical protein
VLVVILVLYLLGALTGSPINFRRY